MNAASLILSRRDEVRRYASSAPRYASVVEEMAGEYGRVYPGKRFDGCLRRISSSQGEGDRFPTEVLEVRDLVVSGEADLAELREFVGAPLPACLVDFYTRIRECLLVLRYPVRIYSPGTLVAAESDIRETEKAAGFPVPEEVTLLRLAHVSRSSSCFALRRFVADGQWRMVVCTDELTSELQSNENLWLPEDCEEFDAWFTRILETDGFPLVKTMPDLFGAPLARRIPNP